MREPLPISGLVGAIVVGKFLLVTATALLLRMPLRAADLAIPARVRGHSDPVVALAFHPGGSLFSDEFEREMSDGFR